MEAYPLMDYLGVSFQDILRQSMGVEDFDKHISLFVRYCVGTDYTDRLVALISSFEDIQIHFGHIWKWIETIFDGMELNPNVCSLFDNYVRDVYSRVFLMDNRQEKYDKNNMLVCEVEKAISDWVGSDRDQSQRAYIPAEVDIPCVWRGKKDIIGWLE